MFRWYQEEELTRDCILATPKRKAMWQTVLNICKRRRLDMKRRKQTPVLSEMNISGWWRRMEGKTPEEPNPKPRGRKM